MDEEQEFQFLECLLKDLGLYEDGMDLPEMRSIRNAVNESIEESSSAFEDELQTAIQESEQMANESMQRSYETSLNGSSNSENCNVLVIGKHSSPPSSPDRPTTITVVAEVHAPNKETSSESDSDQSDSDQSNVTEETEVPIENEEAEINVDTRNLIISPKAQSSGSGNSSNSNDKPKPNSNIIYSLLDTNDDSL